VAGTRRLTLRGLTVGQRHTGDANLVADLEVRKLLVQSSDTGSRGLGAYRRSRVGRGVRLGDVFDVDPLGLGLLNRDLLAGVS
jgi:hypothetical protein